MNMNFPDFSHMECPVFEDMDQTHVLDTPVIEADLVLSTPLLLAADTDNMEDLKALLKAGANVNVRNASGISPLHNAAEKGHLKIAEALIEEGARVDLSDNLWNTPLHMAAKMENVEIVKTLVKAGANVNFKNAFNSTPLHEAAETDNVEIVKVLMIAGANPKIMNVFLETPLQIVPRKQSSGNSADATFAKFPVTNLSCAQVMIKYSLLHYYYKKFCSMSDDSWKSFDVLPEFSKKCFYEVTAMSKDLITKKAYLYDYLNKIYANPKIQRSINCISDVIFQRVLSMKYPFYSDVLCENLGRNYFEEKFIKYSLYAKLQPPESNQREITLDANSMLAIAKCVPIYDLAIFVFAFTDSNFQ